jgi:hypothetical protein
MKRLALSFFVTLCLAGCPGPAPTDAGADTPPMDAPASDVPTADAPPADVPPRDTPCACDADQTCLRGVCVATCAGAAGLEAALGAGVVPVSHACRSPAVFGTVGTNVYELEAVPGAGGSTTLRLVRWALGNGAVTPTTLAERTYAPTMAELVFPGFVAVSADETHALFGYTTTLGGVVGGVVDVTTATMTFDETSAPGNFDALFLAGRQYLLNGLGFDAMSEPAVYLVDPDGGGARVAIGGTGDASGSLGLWADEGLIVAGGARFGSTWPDGSSGGYVFFVESVLVTGSTVPLDAFADAERLAIPTAFELLSGGRLAALRYDASFAVDGIEVHQLERSGTGAITSAPPISIATGSTFTTVGSIEDDAILVHAGGALRVRLP